MLNLLRRVYEFLDQSKLFTTVVKLCYFYPCSPDIDSDLDSDSDVELRLYNVHTDDRESVDSNPKPTNTKPPHGFSTTQESNTNPAEEKTQLKRTHNGSFSHNPSLDSNSKHTDHGTLNSNKRHVATKPYTGQKWNTIVSHKELSRKEDPKVQDTTSKAQRRSSVIQLPTVESGSNKNVYGKVKCSSFISLTRADSIFCD